MNKSVVTQISFYQPGDMKDKSSVVFFREVPVCKDANRFDITHWRGDDNSYIPSPSSWKRIERLNLGWTLFAHQGRVGFYWMKR